MIGWNDPFPGRPTARTEELEPETPVCPDCGSDNIETDVPWLDVENTIPAPEGTHFCNECGKMLVTGIDFPA